MAQDWLASQAKFVRFFGVEVKNLYSEISRKKIFLMQPF